MAKARKSRKTPISVMPAATDIRCDEALVKLAAPPCGCNTNSPGLLPEYTSPIDGLDRLAGTLARPVILHGVAPGRDPPIIVDQKVATGGNLRIKAVSASHVDSYRSPSRRM